MASLHQHQQGPLSQRPALDIRRGGAVHGRSDRIPVGNFRRQLAEPRGAGKSIRRAGSHGSLLRRVEGVLHLFDQPHDKRVLVLRHEAVEVEQKRHDAVSDALRLGDGLPAHSEKLHVAGIRADHHCPALAVHHRGSAVSGRHAGKAHGRPAALDVTAAIVASEARSGRSYRDRQHVVSPLIDTADFRAGGA